MSVPLPERNRAYLGPATNTESWDGFALRPSDIILSTPPKSGTTWSQAILMMLIHGRADNDTPVWKDSKWLDCGFRDRVELARQLEAQDHRRCLKSHTPLDGISYSPDATYIVVYRHPIDVHFSYKRHVANMKDDWLDFVFPEPSEAAFDRFLNAPATDMGTDDLTLASLLYHYHSFQQWAHLPNIHFFHFADLKHDPQAQIRRLAHVAGLPASEPLVNAIADASSFGSMKETTRKSVDPATSVFKDAAGFFASGTSNKWHGRLSPEQLANYDKVFSRQATGPDRLWLENGSQAL